MLENLWKFIDKRISIFSKKLLLKLQTTAAASRWSRPRTRRQTRNEWFLPHISCFVFLQNSSLFHRHFLKYFLQWTITNENVFPQQKSGAVYFGPLKLYRSEFTGQRGFGKTWNKSEIVYNLGPILRSSIFNFNFQVQFQVWKSPPPPQIILSCTLQEGMLRWFLWCYKKCLTWVSLYLWMAVRARFCTRRFHWADLKVFLFFFTFSVLHVLQFWVIFYSLLLPPPHQKKLPYSEYREYCIRSHHFHPEIFKNSHQGFFCDLVRKFRQTILFVKILLRRMREPCRTGRGGGALIVGNISVPEKVWSWCVQAECKKTGNFHIWMQLVQLFFQMDVRWINSLRLWTRNYVVQIWEIK